MELEILKDIFFRGEREAIDEFVASLKPRCIKACKEGEARKTTIENGGEVILLYNSEDDTYISPTMRRYFVSPVSGRLFDCDTKITINIVPGMERVERVGASGRRRRFTHETLSSVELDEYFIQDHYHGEGNYYVSRDREADMIKVFDEAGHFCYASRTEEIPNLDNFTDLACLWNGNDFETANMFTIAPKVAVVSVQITESVSKTVLISEYEEHQDMFETCSECGKIFFKQDHMLGEDGRCRFCSQPQIDILSYHGFRGYHSLSATNERVERNTPTFGIEIETQGPEFNKRYVAPYQEIWHLEHDGSIGEGFEMISQPMTWKYIEENKQKFFDMFKALSDAGQKAHETSCCGMHVHISKSSFKNDKAFKKAYVIINGMSSEMVKFARRDSSRWAAFDTEVPYRNFVWENIGKHYHDRYVAFNKEASQNTHEIRIFRSTLNANTMMATIQFINNIIKYANDESKTRVYFKDLLEGKYIEQYVQERSTYGVTFSDSTFIDCSAAEMVEKTSALYAGDITAEDFMAYCQNLVASIANLPAEAEDCSIIF